MEITRGIKHAPLMLSCNAKRRVLMLSRVKINIFTNCMGYFLDVVNVWSFQALQKPLVSFLSKRKGLSFLCISNGPQTSVPNGPIRIFMLCIPNGPQTRVPNGPNRIFSMHSEATTLYYVVTEPCPRYCIQLFDRPIIPYLNGYADTIPYRDMECMSIKICHMCRNVRMAYIFTSLSYICSTQSHLYIYCIATHTY